MTTEMLGKTSPGGLEEIAARLAAPFKKLPRADALLELHPLALTLLAQGRPVAPAELAEAVARPVDDVLVDLRVQRSVEYTEDGEIAGWGLTLHETPHRVTVDGTALYTWCALDTLMYPVVLRRSFAVASPCRQTGELVKVRVSPQGVDDVSPGSAVVSIVVPEDVTDVRASFCNSVHYFASEEAASPWLERHPEGLILSAEDAFTVGALRNEEISGSSTRPLLTRVLSGPVPGEPDGLDRGTCCGG